MKKLLLVSLCFLLFAVTQVYAQRTVTGTVTSKEDGLPVPGVTVLVKGTKQGTQTNVSGKFSLPNVPAGATLVFSFTGFVNAERPVGTGTVDVALETSNKELGEVVIAGTEGRKLTEKSVGYAQTHLAATDVNASAETNLLTGLTGKVAGLQVQTTGSGVDGAIRFVLRGNRSINGNNQALVVVDGSPLPSGDISSIDPNTIESYDILNGGSAGALYGSEASNGVIVITTKKGAAGGKPTINYTNSFQFDQAYFFPSYQRDFGQYGGEGAPYIDPLTGFSLYVPYENQQYGPRFNGATVQLGYPADGPNGPVDMVTYAPSAVDPRKAFWNLGVTEQNNISVGSGTADDYFNFSFQNLIQHGITPLDTKFRNSGTLKAGKRYGIFKADADITYTNTSISQAISSGYGGSIMNALAQFPANLNIKDFADPSSTFANPSNFYDAYAINPYWDIYNARQNTNRDVILIHSTLSVNPTKWMDISYRFSDNFGFSDIRQTQSQVNFSAYSASDPFGAGNIPSTHKTTLNYPGQVLDQILKGDGNGGYSRLQQDAMINLHQTFFGDFKTNLLLGATMFNQYYKQISASANALLVPGLYNIAYNAGSPTASESSDVINQIGYYADLSINYKNWAFIDGTIRNDHDSRLAASNRSFFYPGVSGSFVFTDAIDALKGSKVISYGKIRAAYSITGQVSVGPYQIYDVYGVTSPGFPYGAVGGLSPSSTNYTNLLPERITEFEIGTELSFFDNYLHGTFTYFKQNSRNQTLNIGTSQSTGYSNVVTNVGELQSSGYEAALTISPLTKAKNKFALDIGANLADNESKVISLLPNVPQFNIAGGGGNEYAIVGQPYPVIKGTDFLRDAQGHVIINTANGYPQLNATPQILGRTTPEYVLGINIKASYKFVTLTAIAEYRTGFVSQFQSASTLIFGGTSAYTTQAGRERFIYPNSVYQNAAGNLVPNTSIPVQDGNYGFWQNSAFNSAVSPYVSSAAFWKLREVNLSFALTEFVKKARFIKGLNFALTGRNLFMWVPKTNFWGDPELSTDNSNAIGYQSINNIPAQRTFGAKLDVTL
jgi:TonB-linked SusC/RagA family outer membrane protein